LGAAKKAVAEFGTAIAGACVLDSGLSFVSVIRMINGRIFLSPAATFYFFGLLFPYGWYGYYVVFCAALPAFVAAAVAVTTWHFRQKNW